MYLIQWFKLTWYEETKICYLQSNIDCDDHERVDEACQEPYLDRFDAGGVGEGGGDGEVDGGEDHHARDVHRDDELIATVSADVVGGLVDQVHEECW